MHRIFAQLRGISWGYFLKQNIAQSIQFLHAGQYIIFHGIDAFFTFHSNRNIAIFTKSFIDNKLLFDVICYIMSHIMMKYSQTVSIAINIGWMPVTKVIII